MSEVINYAKAADAWMKGGGREQIAAKLGLTTSPPGEGAQRTAT
jgi:hypothetical protein